VLRAYGGPLYATSANPSGGQAPRSLVEVDPGVADAADLVVTGEPGSGEASAVVDLSGREARLLRATRDLTDEKLRELTSRRPGRRSTSPRDP
jgi:L-threonylcarbamoyladenylate synthase